MKRRRKGTGSVFRHRGRWVATVRGRRVVADNRDAAKALATFLSAKAGTRAHTAATSVADYAETYLARLEARVKPGTARYYHSLYRYRIIPAFGHLPLASVTKAHVKDFVADLLRHLKPRSVQNLRQALYALFAEAHEDGLLGENPAQLRVKITGVKASRAAPKAMTAEQLRAFLKAAATVTPRWALAWRFMALTGARPGEMLALRWSDFSWNTSKVWIRRNVYRGLVQEDTTKGGSLGQVDISSGLLAALKERRAENRGDVYVWPSSTGKPVKAATMRLWFIAAVEAAKLPKHFTPHCLRHTYATQQLLRGASIYYVQKQLRHRTIQQTVDRYGSWLPSTDTAQADAFERALCL